LEELIFGREVGADVTGKTKIPIDEVIVYHSNRLHVRINDGRTNEAESPAFEILAKGVRFK